MWPEMFNFWKIFFAVLLCAAAVKLADDYLDEELDECTGRKNWSTIIGRGAMVYAMLFISIACSLNFSVSASLFISSYVIGMFGQFNVIMPSRLLGYQESLFAFLFGMILLGWEQMLFSFLLVLALQMIDDCVDAYVDCLAGCRNLANRLGTVECLLASILSILFAWLLDPQTFLPVFCAIMVFYIATLCYERGATRA